MVGQNGLAFRRAKVFYPTLQATAGAAESLLKNKVTKAH